METCSTISHRATESIRLDFIIRKAIRARWALEELAQEIHFAGTHETSDHFKSGVKSRVVPAPVSMG